MGGGADEYGSPMHLNLLADGLRRALDDLELYSAMLTETLLAALPAHVLTVRRERGLGDRMRGRAGVVRGLTLDLAGYRYAMARPSGAPPRCTVATVSGGIVLDTTEVALPAWCTAVTGALAEQARVDATAAAALAAMQGLTGGWA